MDDEKVDENLPKNAQICKCGHSRDRHVTYNSGKNLICIEQFCMCSNYYLYTVSKVGREDHA